MQYHGARRERFPAGSVVSHAQEVLLGVPRATETLSFVSLTTAARHDFSSMHRISE